MSTRILAAAMAAATLAFALEPGTALANKQVFTMSGEVTTPPVGQQIVVGGQTYQIAPGSAAATQVAEVVQGENVQLTLNGPANSTATEVVAINETSSQ